MKRNIKRMVALFGVVLTVFCSVAPSYYVYAEDPVSQEVTSDDNIVQKILYFTQSQWGALLKANSGISSIPTSINNAMKETIANLMNGGGIYVDDNGDYVFSNEASQQIYDAMNTNSNTDARVISGFDNFTYYADGYVNAQFLADCNILSAWARDNSIEGYDGDYILFCNRYGQTRIIGGTYYDFTYTNVHAYKLPSDFAFCSIIDGGNHSYSVKFYNTASQPISVPHKSCNVTYSTLYNYQNSISSDPNDVDYLHLMWNYDHLNNYQTQDSTASYYQLYFDKDSFYNSFPYYNNVQLGYRTQSGKYYYGLSGSSNYFCNNSLILGKTVVAANETSLQSTGIFANYTTINTVNKTVLEENNWQNIYNNYIIGVTDEYQQDPAMSAKEFRKIQKKYNQMIISAIQQGTSNIEETVSISNKYLQSISMDVRSIAESINGLTNNGSGGGITEEQYNSIMGKLDDINNNALDIASSTATISSDVDAIWEDTQSMSSDLILLVENTGDTNTNLVAIDTLLQQINNKLRNRRTDNPLPDPDFWDNLDDELDDYTNTMMEDLIFKLQMIGTVLQGVVPFGYLAVLNVMVNALAEEPEEPVFEIDLQSNGATAIPVDWQGTIDLSWVNDIMPIVRSFEVILFIIGLIWATFNVFTALGSLL